MLRDVLKYWDGHLDGIMKMQLAKVRNRISDDMNDLFKHADHRNDARWSTWHANL